MSAVWRLIEHGPVDGALNMALDRAIQLAREEGSGPPTLRLYRWARPTVTLGRFQESDGIDETVCMRKGLDIARRFTGGRGVLHAEELTYSVAARVDDGVPRGVSASYRHLCAALVEAYRLLGVGAALTARDRGEASASACYLQTTRADLSYGELKLSGSAQVWHGSTVLQHGSLTLRRDVGLEASVFRLGVEQTAHLREGTATLDELLREPPSETELREAVAQGFSNALGITLVAGDITAREAELAAGLVAEASSKSPIRRHVRA